MRILIAHSFYRVPGGEDRYVRQQAELLADRHEVRVLAKQNESLTSKVQGALTMAYSRRLKNEVRQEISTFRPDLIHVHNTYPSLGPVVHLVAEELRIPLVMTVHNYRLRCPNGYMFTNGSICRRCEVGAYYNAVTYNCLQTRTQSAAYAVDLWMHRFILRLENRISLFICPSEFVRSQLKRWGIGPERSVLIRNFTDRRPRTRSSPGSFGLYVGRLSEEKGLDVLLEALALAGDPPFRVVGDGPQMVALQEKRAAHGLENTRFVGLLSPSEVEGYLREARFVAIPSLWHENAPLAALEAMACGCPLITSEVGGLPELVGEDRGLSCPPGDPKLLATNIVKLMTDDEFCVSAGSACVTFSREEAQPERHRSRLEDAYRALLQ